MKKSLLMSVFLIGCVCGFFLQHARAWVEPSSNPPNGNVGAPINTSNLTQIKQGNLSLNAIGAYVNALLIPFGNVGIGTIAPEAKLDVQGNAEFGDDTSNLELVKNGQTFEIRHHDPGIAWRNISLNPYGGNIGIGTTTPAQKLSVAGTIETTSGGIKFPDATVQTTAARAVSGYISNQCRIVEKSEWRSVQGFTLSCNGDEIATNSSMSRNHGPEFGCDGNGYVGSNIQDIRSVYFRQENTNCGITAKLVCCKVL